MERPADNEDKKYAIEKFLLNGVKRFVQKSFYL